MKATPGGADERVSAHIVTEGSWFHRNTQTPDGLQFEPWGGGGSFKTTLWVSYNTVKQFEE